jgi:hypothetical protein
MSVSLSKQVDQPDIMVGSSYQVVDSAIFVLVTPQYALEKFQSFIHFIVLEGKGRERG